jgi:hypothetical protein
MKKFFTLAWTFAFLASSFAVAIPATAQTVILKKGTQIDGTLQQTLSSKTSHTGDTFTLTEKDTFFHKNAPISGATIDGHVENVSPAGPTHKATMTIVFDDIKLPDGTTAAFPASLKSLSTFEPHTHHIRDLGLIVGGAMAGHMVAKSHHGGLAGAAAGFALASSLKSDIVVKSGTLVKLKLTHDLIDAPAVSPS